MILPSLLIYIFDLPIIQSKNKYFTYIILNIDESNYL